MMTEIKFHPDGFQFEWPALEIETPIRFHRLEGFDPEILKSTLKVTCDDPVQVEVLSVEISRD